MFCNIPEVKPGIIAVSRDCFPIDLSIRRRKAIVNAYAGELYECPVTVENEKDMLSAVADVKAAGCNALIVFLGNFGPETPETLIAKYFHGPCMFVAAAEGDGVGIHQFLHELLQNSHIRAAWGQHAGITDQTVKHLAGIALIQDLFAAPDLLCGS